MIPKHQELVDDVLWRVYQRTEELLSGTGMGTSIRVSDDPRTREHLTEPLRGSPLGRHLSALAHYAEGYPYPFERDVQDSIRYVRHLLFRDFLLLAPKDRPQLPVKFHRTELGKLVNDALLRFYQEERPGQLMSITQVRTQLDVSRQAIHQWADQGYLSAVYIQHTAHFPRQEVTRLRRRRTQRQTPKKS